MRNRELKQRNDELDQFSSVVSHDLKEPLRAITGFAALLQESLAAGEFESMESDLEKIVSAGSRMQRMINGLLQLGRLGANGIKPRSVRIEEVIQHALEILRGRMDETGARVDVRVPRRAVWWVDPDLSLHLVSNLLSNAIKHSGPGPRPHVEIGTREVAEETRLLVRDHGPGVPYEQRERIFQPFHRLNTSQEGSGVGLAICRKVVEVSAGRIWIEQPPGGGALFCAALPRRRPEVIECAQVEAQGCISSMIHSAF